MATVTLADRRASLKSCTLFADLAPDTLGLLAEAVRVEAFAAGEDVCLKGEAADCVYVVHRGSLGVYLPALADPVTVLQRHDLFGEYGLFTGVRTSRIRALEPALLLSVDYPRFKALMHQFPSVMYGVLETTVARLARAEARLAGTGG
jgi:CRP-like cAMP-binding protein